jgi:hypothetical protein
MSKESSITEIKNRTYESDENYFIQKLDPYTQENCVAAYSSRQLNSNYTGPVICVRRSNDNSESNFYADAYGNLGTAIYGKGISLSDWLSTGTGFIKTMYDQSGNNRHVSQLTNENQPIISVSNSRTATITYSGSQWLDVRNSQMPSILMTSNSSGNFIATASTETSNREAYRAFNKTRYNVSDLTNSQILGNNGGRSFSSADLRGGAGGGGATQAGFNTSSQNGSNGGQGYSTDISGTTVVYGSGGGGGRRQGNNGVGGTNAGSGPGTNAVANTGSGGGGAEGIGSLRNGGFGGSGIVIIRYNTTNDNSITAVGGSESTSGSFRIHRFTTVGTNTITITKGGSCDILVVGGGGGGGENIVPGYLTPGGGGGGGKVIHLENYKIRAGNYTVIVGSRGGNDGGDGGFSSFNGIVADGGGGGGGSSHRQGNSGGSGGGGSRNSIGGVGTLNIGPDNDGWRSNPTYDTTTGNYIGNISTTDKNGKIYNGEWIQLQLISSIKLDNFYITSSSNPLDFTLLGSNDSNTWTNLYEETNGIWTSSTKYFTIVNVYPSYNFFRLVVGKIKESNTTGSVEINELIFNNTSVPLTEKSNTYTFFADWKTTSSNTSTIVEQSRNTTLGGTRASLTKNSTNYGFNSTFTEENSNNIITVSNNSSKKTVLVCNPTNQFIPITNGLIAWFDPSDNRSYSGTGATIGNLLSVLNTSGSFAKGTLGGAYSYNTTYNGIRLSNNNSDANLNISNLQLESLSNVTTVSLWYYQHSASSTRYLLDGRNGGAGGWIWSGGPGSNWDSGILYKNGSTSASITWANIESVGTWQNVTLIANTPFTDDITLFAGGGLSQGLDVTFGPILVYNRAITQDENKINYETMNRKLNNDLRNILLIDNGVTYRSSTSLPNNLNVGGDIFSIGRRFDGSEYFIGEINEVIVINKNISERDALLYYTPTSMIKNKLPLLKPYKSVNFHPIRNNPVDSRNMIAELTLNLISSSHEDESLVSNWNGYTSMTNQPKYFKSGGLRNDTGYINFNRNGQHLDGGSKTLNIATNGGFTSICLVQFAGTPGYFERVYSFGQHLLCRDDTSSRIMFNLSNNENYNFVVSISSPNGTIVQGEWALFACRYRSSDNYCEIRKNGILLTSGNGGSVIDRTVSYSRIGTEYIGSHEDFSGNIAGIYIYDRYVSDTELSALSNALITQAFPKSIPQYLDDYINVDISGSVLSWPMRDGWAGYFDGSPSSYIDVRDVPAPPMSFSFWFNSSSSTYATIVGLTDANRVINTQGGIQIDYPTATNRLTFYLALPTPWSVIHVNDILINTWYRIIVTINTNFQVSVYVSGGSISFQSQVTGSAYPSNKSRFIIGASGDISRGYIGSIYDFRIYDYVLTGTDVFSLVSINPKGKQNTLVSPSNYLVNFRNWYTIMQSMSIGTYLPTIEGVDPNVQIKLTDNSFATHSNSFYNYTRIQDYKSFRCSFEIVISNALRGNLWFFCGSTDIPLNENNPNGGYMIIFGLNRVSLRNSNNATVASSLYNSYVNINTWVPVIITYDRTKDNGYWEITVGNETITYINTDNESWLTSVTSTTIWGIGARTFTLSETMNSFIRRVELSYIPYETSIVNFQSGIINNLKKFPESSLTSNSSQQCIASASSELSSSNAAWKVFDNLSGDSYSSILNVYNTSGSYIGNTTTIVNDLVYSGEWLQLQLPNEIRLIKYELTWPDNLGPNTWIIAGSNDGNTWKYLSNETNITDWAGNNKTFNVKVKNNLYKYFRIICTITGQIGSERNKFSLTEWKLYSIPFIGTKYPIGKLSSDTTTIKGSGLGNGTYNVTYSSFFDNNYLGWRAFNNDTSDAYHVSNDGNNGSFWYSSNGVYLGTTSTIISGSSYLGEWLQIQLPNSISLTSYSLTPRISNSDQMCKNWKLAGSNDNITWTEIDSRTNITNWSNAMQSFKTTINTKYTYYRLICNATVNSVAWSMSDWALYDETMSLNNTKPIGLLEGLTWKYYEKDLSENPTAFLINNYKNIGRTCDISNINLGTNGEYSVNGRNFYSIEWVGYFRASITGNYTFYTASDDWSYLWIGDTALAGYTTSNATVNNGGYHDVQERSGTVYLIKGVYYPIRIQWGEGVGGDDCQVSFTPPNGTRTYNGTGYYFSSIGTNQAYPAESAKIIKDISNTNKDGIYYINVNGISTETYCLMNDIYDGGGWMLLLKSDNDNTFNFSANYWTQTNTLNSTETNRNVGNAKFDTFNYMYIKDVMAIFPDIPSSNYTNIYGVNGGSLNLKDGWCWKVNNWYDVSYPPYGLTGNNQTLNGITYTISSGTSFFSGRDNWRAFNYLLADGEEWHSGDPIFNVSTGNYTGNITTVIDGITYFGEFLQIQMSSPQYIDKFGMYPRPGYPYRTPRSFIFAGSNNGSTWTSLYTTSDSQVVEAWRYFDLTRPGSYSYYRIVIRSIFPNQFSTSVQIGEMRLFANGSSTALNGFQRTRDAHPSNPYVFNGFSTGLFSNQLQTSRHIFGGGSHLSSNINVRWGLLFNDTVNNFLTCDTGCGIGLDVGYSIGDWANSSAITSGSSRSNRSMRIEMYGR